MSGDTDGSSVTEHEERNGGYKVSLRDFFEQAIDNLDERMAARMKGHDKEHSEHEKAHHREHEDTKTALLLATSKLDEQLGTLERKLEGQFDRITTDLGGVRSRLDLGPPSLTTLQTRSDQDIGRRTGGLENRALLFSAIGALGAVVVILGFLAAR